MNASARTPVHKERYSVIAAHMTDYLKGIAGGREREVERERDRRGGGREVERERERELFLGYFCSRIKNLLSTLFCYMPNSLCINVE